MAKKPYYHKSDLKKRGWTDTMIRDFITDADMYEGNHTTRPHLDYYYYDRNCVEATEKTKEFKDRKPKKKAVK